MASAAGQMISFTQGICGGECLPDFVERLIVAGVGPVIALVVAAFVGLKLNAKWAERQKRREQELALWADFASAYGDCVAIRRQWKWSLDELGKSGGEPFARVKLDLIERSAKAEGLFETVALRISSERILSFEEVKFFGRLRQILQSWRRSIEKNEKISYGSATNLDYNELKECLIEIRVLLRYRAKEKPNNRRALDQFKCMTCNHWETASIHNLAGAKCEEAGEMPLSRHVRDDFFCPMKCYITPPASIPAPVPHPFAIR